MKNRNTMFTSGRARAVYPRTTDDYTMTQADEIVHFARARADISKVELTIDIDDRSITIDRVDAEAIAPTTVPTHEIDYPIVKWEFSNSNGTGMPYEWGFRRFANEVIGALMMAGLTVRVDGKFFETKTPVFEVTG